MSEPSSKSVFTSQSSDEFLETTSYSREDVHSLEFSFHDLTKVEFVIGLTDGSSLKNSSSSLLLAWEADGLLMLIFEKDPSQTEVLDAD